MPDKLMRLRRNDAVDTRRPVMLAIAGDSAAGKSTLTRGLVEALGPERITAVCSDDYHRYDREERRTVAIPRWTPTETTSRSWSSTFSTWPAATRS